MEHIKHDMNKLIKELVHEINSGEMETMEVHTTEVLSKVMDVLNYVMDAEDIKLFKIELEQYIGNETKIMSCFC